VVVLAAALGAGILVPVASARPDSGPDLDVLFVGAHPDDEASLLSTFGRWQHDHQVRTGVATITRGEGGGNAVGPEEGPELGLLREEEERRAVGALGITDVYNLDKPDLYYTVSAPLTEQAWRHDDVLARLVRVVRQTRPEVVVTMDPAPTPGNHGNHQYVARLALEAYRQAADPAAFPEQIGEEGLDPWSVRRVLSNAAGAEEEVQGPDCEKRTTPTISPGREYYVWGGAGDPSWEQRERLAEREYRSQGWANRPDIPTDPAQIGCDHLTELANRAPHVPGAQGADAPLLGALLPVPGGLPIGTGLTATPERTQVVPGGSTRVRVEVTAPAETALHAGRVTLDSPPGWQVQGDGAFGPLEPGASAAVEFTVTVPDQHRPERVPLPVRVESPQGTGQGELRLDVVPPVVAEQAPLPGVAEFQRWAAGAQFSLLLNKVAPVQTIPALGKRDVQAVLHNYGQQPRSGAVRFAPPQGFAVPNAEQQFQQLAPGETRTLTFDVHGTDAGMPTGMQGGDHPYSLTTRTDDGSTGESTAALELVPTATIPQAGVEPVVDGEAGPQEYPGAPLDASALWEGDECVTPEDCSATARLSWRGDALHVLVDVMDDKQGALLAPEDCKRHWRTDAVEIAVDPKADSENTSSTFKVAALPTTGGSRQPCYARDADNHQGPGEETAPGVVLGSKLRPGGYTVELAIPLRTLPGSVDPQRMGLNVMVYDSDTEDLTGETRIGWSTWGGVQGDPYRWGRAILQDRPADQPAPPPAPVLPLDALSSVDSPRSIEQAVRLKTSLGGAPPAREAARLTDAKAQPGAVQARLAANGPGVVHLFVLDANGVVLGDQRINVDGQGNRDVQIAVRGGTPTRVLAGFGAPEGATAASAVQLP
jgi:LmbE family N-acetylglucosaminyl deacetylase